MRLITGALLLGFGVLSYMFIDFANLYEGTRGYTRPSHGLHYLVIAWLMMGSGTLLLTWPAVRRIASGIASWIPKKIVTQLSLFYCQSLHWEWTWSSMLLVFLTMLFLCILGAFIILVCSF